MIKRGQFTGGGQDKAGSARYFIQNKGPNFTAQALSCYSRFKGTGSIFFRVTNTLIGQERWQALAMGAGQ